MTQNLNQFNPTGEAGLLTYGIKVDGLNARIDPNSAEAVDSFLPGTPLKIVDSVGPVIVVDRCAPTEYCDGFLRYDAKKAARSPGDMIEMFGDGNVMKLTAGAAILAGALVEIAAGDKVITSAGTNKIIGKALQKATADGDIINVLLKTPLIVQV